MHDWKQFVRRHLPSLALPGEREVEVVEELAEHLEATYRDAREGGASHEEALAGLLPEGVSWASLAGDLERAEGAGQSPATARRVTGGGSPLDSLWQDLRYGVRSLVANPTFAVIALLTLGVGIGANTAVFSIADHVLLRPLPYDGADRIAIVRADVEGLESIASLSAVELLDLRERSTTLEEVAGVWSSTAALTGNDDPEQVRFSWATSNLFSMMGVEPILGRTFTDDEEAPNGPDVVILSGELWRRRYGADPDIVGRTIELNDRARLVVGVLPAGFRLLLGADTDVSSEVDVWAPQTYWVNRSMRWLRILVKTAPGTTFAQAQEEIDVITDSLKREFPEYANHPDLAFHVVPLHQDLVRDVRPALLALVGAVGFVLLIVCTNLANLLVARTRARGKELVVRAVLGAGRMRVVRQILTESLVLALAGGALGLALAHAALTALPALAPPDLPRLQDITLDARVALFAFGISLASLLLFGLAPALHGTSFRLNDTLKESGRSGGRRMSAALRGGLVVAELSISFVLLIGAALMVQTFVNLANEDLGFDPDDVVTMRMHLANGAYPTPESRWQFQRALHERIESLPGVHSSAAVSLLPLGGGLFTSPYAYDAESERDFGALSADYRSVTPGYFETMRGELVAGRLFDMADSASGRRAVIVDDSLAREAWPSKNPIGQRVKVDLAAGVPESNPEWMDVVGVVKHLRHAGVREDGRPQIYFPYWLRPVHGMNLVVRASGSPDIVAQAVREEVKELGSRRPVHRARSLESYVGQAMARSRFTVSIMVAFAAIALVLAVMGIYGVIAATVSQRTHELGVRIALGANVRDIVRMVLSQAATFITLGALLGLAGALALGRFLENLVFGVATTDPITFAVAGFVIATASLLACARPAWRGSKVEPVIALRHD